MSFTVGSLFSGIGGLDLGLERAGMQVKWQVEIDEYCQRVLAKHWPQTPRFGDIRDVGSHNLQWVDLICGGFPCQDISFAGRGAGITGERSGLFFELMRVVRNLQPQFVLLENSTALLVRGMDRVLGELASCGYDAQWDCIPACAVGSRQLRYRLFIVATSREMDDSDSLNPRRVFGQTESERWWDEDNSIRPRFGWGAWSREPDVARVAYGIPRRVDRLRGLGNAVVPQVAEFIGRRILASLETGHVDSE